jgi:3-isopropylmalate/(R)-2-methylmalate dehydratase large subunit
MGLTIAEKVLSRAAGARSVHAGDEIHAKPDFVIVYDLPGITDILFRQVKAEFGVDKLIEPGRFAVFIDHMVPPSSPKEEELHIQTRNWCKEYGVSLYERRGIGHQVCTEIGYAVPGAFVVHFDGHISQLGAFGTFAMGIRRNILEAFVRERVAMKVPATTRINFDGRLRAGVMARDVFHHIIGKLGPMALRFHVMELAGEGLADISIEGRQSICGNAMFIGASTAVINPDQKTLDHALSRARIKLDPVESDSDAAFAAEHRVDLDEVEPVIVIPPNPSNTRRLRDYIGLSVDAGYLGSCVSGRLEDLRAAAKVLKGRRIKDGFSLHVVPSSQDVMAKAASEGLITTLVEAGAFISSSSCDYCFGHIATMSAGQRAVSTGTLNVPGRMGSPESEIYICNAAAVAAAAIEGKVADPRDYM